MQSLAPCPCGARTIHPAIVKNGMPTAVLGPLEDAHAQLSVSFAADHALGQTLRNKRWCMRSFDAAQAAMKSWSTGVTAAFHQWWTFT